MMTTVHEFRITVDAVTDEGVMTKTFLQKKTEDVVDTLARFDEWIEDCLGVYVDEDDDEDLVR